MPRFRRILRNQESVSPASCPSHYRADYCAENPNHNRADRDGLRQIGTAAIWIGADSKVRMKIPKARTAQQANERPPDIHYDIRYGSFHTSWTSQEAIRTRAPRPINPADYR
jgi:hypothetical protein